MVDMTVMDKPGTPVNVTITVTGAATPIYQVNPDRILLIETIEYRNDGNASGIDLSDNFYMATTGLVQAKALGGAYMAANNYSVYTFEEDFKVLGRLDGIKLSGVGNTVITIKGREI